MFITACNIDVLRSYLIILDDIDTCCVIFIMFSDETSYMYFFCI